MNKLLVILLTIASTIAAVTESTDDVQSDAFKPRASPGLTSILNPIGLVKSARRLLTNGVQKFRQNIEAVQRLESIALKESVDAEVAQRESTAEQSSLAKMFRDDFLKLPRDGILGGIFRLIGVDSSSIGMIVLNMLIFVAEMITSSTIGKEGSTPVDTRMLKENLMEWFIRGKNDQVDYILGAARDSTLPDNIISSLQSQTGNHTACIQLLICKMTPFIWGFQKTLTGHLDSSRNNETDSYDPRSLFGINVWDSLSQVFPDRKKFVSYGDSCENRFPKCKLLKFDKRNLE